MAMREQAQRGAKKPDRLNALTDVAAAFAITVMVLDIHPPQDTSVVELKHIAPIMGAYVLAFLTIAIFWSNHHLLTATIKRVDGRAMWANMGLLFFLALLPYSVRGLDEAGSSSRGHARSMASSCSGRR